MKLDIVKLAVFIAVATATFVGTLLALDAVVPVDAAHNTGHCGGTYKDETAPFSITVNDGAIAHEVFIKSGDAAFPENEENDKCSLAITQDGVYNGYVVAGLGTQTVTVTETDEAPHDISHIEANNQVVDPTPTPAPTGTPPASPPVSTDPPLTPSPVVPTPTPSATPTPTPSTTPDPTPSPTSTSSQTTPSPAPTTTITPQFPSQFPSTGGQPDGSTMTYEDRVVLALALMATLFGLAFFVSRWMS